MRATKTTESDSREKQWVLGVREGGREGRTKRVLELGVLDKGGVGRSVDEGSGQRVAPLFYSDGSRGWWVRRGRQSRWQGRA